MSLAAVRAHIHKHSAKVVRDFNYAKNVLDSVSKVFGVLCINANWLTNWMTNFYTKNYYNFDWSEILTADSELVLGAIATCHSFRADSGLDPHTNNVIKNSFSSAGISIAPIIWSIYGRPRHLLSQKEAAQRDLAMFICLGYFISNVCSWQSDLTSSNVAGILRDAADMLSPALELATTSPFVLNLINKNFSIRYPLQGEYSRVESITPKRAEVILQDFLYPEYSKRDNSQGIANFKVYEVFNTHLDELKKHGIDSSRSKAADWCHYLANFIDQPYDLKEAVECCERERNLRMGPQTSFYFYLALLTYMRDKGDNTPETSKRYELLAYHFFKANGKLKEWGEKYKVQGQEGANFNHLPSDLNTIEEELNSFQKPLEGLDFAHRIARFTQTAIEDTLESVSKETVVTHLQNQRERWIENAIEAGKENKEPEHLPEILSLENLLFTQFLQEKEATLKHNNDAWKKHAIAVMMTLDTIRGAAKTATWADTRGTAWDVAWDAAKTAASDTSRDAARTAIKDAAWATAWDAAWATALDAVWNTTWNAAWTTAWNATRDAASDAASDTAWDAVWHAQYSLNTTVETMNKIAKDLSIAKYLWTQNQDTRDIKYSMVLWKRHKLLTSDAIDSIYSTAKFFTGSNWSATRDAANQAEKTIESATKTIENALNILQMGDVYAMENAIQQVSKAIESCMHVLQRTQSSLQDAIRENKKSWDHLNVPHLKIIGRMSYRVAETQAWITFLTPEKKVFQKTYDTVYSQLSKTPLKSTWFTSKQTYQEKINQYFIENRDDHAKKLLKIFVYHLNRIGEKIQFPEDSYAKDKEWLAFPFQQRKEQEKVR
ncbi:MAG: hypothetical protein OXT67_01520 [Zetaproteobacteria bacterium]|nr:hypothetical protein [Zetaproteobacteria bacterium]